MCPGRGYSSSCVVGLIVSRVPMRVRCRQERPSLSARPTPARASRPPAATAARHISNGAHHAPSLCSLSRSALAMSDYRREEAINETRSRQTNEWIQEANDRFGAEHPMDEYRCECSDGQCVGVVSLTRPEYEAVRADGLRFFIALNHENPETRPPRRLARAVLDRGEASGRAGAHRARLRPTQEPD